MREILFRAKTDGIHSRWVYGFYVREVFSDGVDHILTNGIYDGPRDDSIGESYCVLPETIGQYSGMRDNTGNRIFEGDILEERIRGRSLKDGTPAYRTRKYIVCCGDWSFYLEAIGAFGNPSRCVSRCKIIGNIHDNPELLDKGGT